MNRKITMLLTLVALSSTNANALVDLRSNTSVTYGKATADFIDTKPTLLNYTEDLHGLYTELPYVEAGLGASFRFVRQTSYVLGSVGSFKGNRWEIYPVVGKRFDKLWAGIAPVFLLGRYSMSKQTADKKDVYYTSPLGAKVYLSYDLSEVFPVKMINWGVSLTGDYMTYKNFTSVTTAGVSKDSEMGSRLKLWSVGLALNINYGLL